MFDPGYFDQTVFDAGGSAAGAGFGPTEYFDCAYFDEAYFDVSGDCGEQETPTGGRAPVIVVTQQRPDDEELVALI